MFSAMRVTIIFASPNAMISSISEHFLVYLSLAYPAKPSSLLTYSFELFATTCTAQAGFKLHDCRLRSLPLEYLFNKFSK